jgi:phosphatidylglycerol---prolipoprotein diacylglyceryl transferase
MLYPDINPVAYQLGPISIYWYGVMYLLGFILAFFVLYWNSRNQRADWTINDILDLFFYVTLGVIFGGTWGYLLFYEPGLLINDPLKIVRFWEPGRSFHGGLIGVVLGMFLFSRAHRRNFWEVCDYAAAVTPIGIATGRLGNFLNAELWGRVTDSSWGMVFPRAGELARHPSQLYEFALEGVALFILLQWYIQKRRPVGAVSGLFLLGYGFFRFMVEFLREPDWNHGFVALGWLTMGQVLSIPMMVGGVLLFMIAKQHSGMFARR